MIMIQLVAMAQLLIAQTTNNAIDARTPIEIQARSEAYEVANKQVDVNDVSIFYREAGDPAAETILMLHGFPSSSHMFRDIIDGLSDQYHVIAPDYPGFGFSSVPNTDDFDYTFENISIVIEKFADELGIEKFYLMMHDYGGPVGMRIAVRNPNRIQGLIIQNANTYMQGLGEWSQKIGAYVQNQQFKELEEFKAYLMSAEGVKMQYTAGSRDASTIDAVSYLTDIAFLDRTNVRKIQSILFDNYGTNFHQYLEWQSYLRSHQPRTLILWGENDKYFAKAGGEAYRNDLEEVEIHFFDAGHFMLEEFPREAVKIIRSFLNKG